MVQFLERNTSRSDAYRLNDVKCELLPEDFVRKVKDPQLVVVGRKCRRYQCVLDISQTLFILLNFFMNSFDYRKFSSKDDVFQ